jgi:hypothetical protein
MRDRDSKRRQCFGEKQGPAKLTDEIVLQIRKEVSEKTATKAELARRYGVHWETIYLVAKGISWKHLPMDLD